MFKRLGFLFNADFCIGCKACEVACKNENQTASAVMWRKVQDLSEEATISISCNHCDSPECFRVCPEKAFSKRQDGIVQINTELCSGCQLCLTACPFSAPQFNLETRRVSKCTMCAERQDNGLPPACIEACTTSALRIVDLNQFKDPAASLTLPDYPFTQTTKPSIVFYPVKPKQRYFLK